MPKPSKSRNERGHALFAGGNSQNDLHGTHKTLEPPRRRRQSQKQICYELSKRHINTLMETIVKTGEFPQKKQRLESPHASDLDDCENLYGKDFDLIFLKVMEEYIDPGSVSSESPRTPETSTESSTSTTTDSWFDSDSSAPSLTNDSRSSYQSIPSSRSSSRAPDIEKCQIDFPNRDILTCDVLLPCGSDFQNAVFNISGMDPPICKPAPSSLPSEFSDDNVDTTPLVSLEMDQVELKVQGRSELQQEDEYPDQSSFTASVAPSNRSHPTGSPVTETENQSTEGDSSSHSQDSSAISDFVVNDVNEDDDHCSNLQDLIKIEWRTDPEVAEHLCRSLEGRLECAPPVYTEQSEDRSNFSLLRLLELQDSSILENSQDFTTYAPSSSGQSSSSSSSTPNKGGTASSSKGQIHGPGPTGKRPAPPSEDRGQVTKSRKTSRTNPSQAAEIQLLRCFHNALAPEIFCINHDTQQKYRTCGGPGWNSIQHIKEHMKNHHTSKPNPLQCNRCQEEFRTQAMLKHHEKNVDCPIRCPECPEIFELKANRQTHQESTHPPDTKDNRLMDIDEAMDKRIKDNLKAYVDSLKKGKGRIEAELEQWVEANTERFMVGRGDKVNPKLELGQWYIICMTLSPDGKVSQHPFYEYGVSHSELVTEKILLIQEKVIDAKMDVHGPPPYNIQAQRDWYQDALRETLKFAAKTTLVMPVKSEQSAQQHAAASTSMPSLQQPSSSNADFNVPIMGARSQMQRINSQQTDLTMSPLAYLQEDPQQAGFMSTLEDSPANMNMGTGILGQPYLYFPQATEGGNQSPFDPQYNYEYAQSYNLVAETSGSNIVGHPQYLPPSPEWTRQQEPGWPPQTE